MITLVKQYRSVIFFILKFFSVYAVLTWGYSAYLNSFQEEPDHLTVMVAEQSQHLIQMFGYNSEVIPHESEPIMKLLVNGTYLARVLEGCNSVSVLILFVTFIIAFTGRLWTSVLFVVLGSLAIYVANVVRIALIAIAIYEYPHYQDALHQIVFPAIIYGLVFLLWVLWVNKFSSR